MAFDWEQQDSVGVESLDAEHRQILRRVRHLVKSVSDGGADEIRSAMRLLHSALAEHYAIEEAWMSDAGYPAAREHSRAHASLLERLSSARGDEAAGAAALTEVAATVVRLLDEHMRTEDLKLGRFWTARENLRRLAEEGPGVGMCLTPIPGSLAAVAPPGRRPAPSASGALLTPSVGVPVPGAGGSGRRG